MNNRSDGDACAPSTMPFRIGEWVRLLAPWHYEGRVAGTRADGLVDVETRHGAVAVHPALLRRRPRP